MMNGIMQPFAHLWSDIFELKENVEDYRRGSPVFVPGTRGEGRQILLQGISVAVRTVFFGAGLYKAFSCIRYRSFRPVDIALSFVSFLAIPLMDRYFPVFRGIKSRDYEENEFQKTKENGMDVTAFRRILNNCQLSRTRLGSRDYSYMAEGELENNAFRWAVTIRHTGLNAPEVVTARVMHTSAMNLSNIEGDELKRLEVTVAAMLRDSFSRLNFQNLQLDGTRR